MKKEKPMLHGVSKIGIALSAAVLLALVAACGGGSGDRSPSDDSPGAKQDDHISSLIRSWDEDMCDILDPDPIVAKMDAEGYETGPESLGPDAGLQLGAVKCVATYHIVDTERSGRTTSNSGILYLVVSPNGDSEGAKEHFDALVEEEQSFLSDYVDRAAVWTYANRELSAGEGDWEEGYIVGAVPVSGRSWFTAYYWDESYSVMIKVEWDRDPTLALSVNSMIGGTEVDIEEADRDFAFTPLSLGQWMLDEYLRDSHASIQNRIEEGLAG